MLLEEGAPHGDIQILFTVCEEGGVNGSRCLDRSKLRADVGYALDGEGAPGEIVVGAPGRRNIKSTLSAEPRMADWSRKGH